MKQQSRWEEQDRPRASPPDSGARAPGADGPPTG